MPSNVNARDAIRALPAGTVFIPTVGIDYWNQDNHTSYMWTVPGEYSRFKISNDLLTRPNLRRVLEIGLPQNGFWYETNDLHPDYRFTIVRYGMNGVLQYAL